MNTKYLLLALGALLLVAAIPREEPGEICRDSIEGSWDEVGGTNYVPGYTYNFKMGMLNICWQGPDIEYQFKVDHSRWPATFEMVGTLQSFHGIFAVDGESMKLCFSAIGTPPPTDFTQNNGQFLRLLKRTRR